MYIPNEDLYRFIKPGDFADLDINRRISNEIINNLGQEMLSALLNNWGETPVDTSLEEGRQQLKTSKMFGSSGATSPWRTIFK
ncbi:MAG: hypothetical protein KatS3mg083_249 [Candidatus Dojkabacteria bacterium]|nr:MAG: hypothetical protein KatS3mg083_249 [Candidatus Dojkabacteria bacterium]